MVRKAERFVSKERKGGVVVFKVLETSTVFPQGKEHTTGKDSGWPNPRDGSVQDALTRFRELTRIVGVGIRPHTRRAEREITNDQYTEYYGDEDGLLHPYSPQELCSHYSINRWGLGTHVHTSPVPTHVRTYSSYGNIHHTQSLLKVLVIDQIRTRTANKLSQRWAFSIPCLQIVRQKNKKKQVRRTSVYQRSLPDQETFCG